MPYTLRTSSSLLSIYIYVYSTQGNNHLLSDLFRTFNQQFVHSKYVLFT
jgi:hypothetical protein